MASLLSSAKLFLRGPVRTVAGLVSAALTVAGIVVLILDASVTAALAFICGALAALVIASFWSFHLSHRLSEEKKTSLPHRIDDLHRAGADLLNELSAPVEPEETKKGEWQIAFSDAPAEWWEKVADFDQQIRDLFIEQYPALLSDYAHGANDHLREKREAREAEIAAADPSKDKRRGSEKMLDFANRIRQGPAERLEASLEGLVAARHRVG